VTPVPERRERGSIAQRLSLVVSGVTVLVTVLALAALLGEAWRRYDDNLRRRAAGTIAFLAESLRVPLWSLDTEAAATIGAAVARDEIVARLDVVGTRGVSYFAQSNSNAVAFEERRSVVWEGRPVGEVRLAVSAEPGRRFLWSVALVAGFTGSVVAALQLLLIGPLLRRQLRAPFESLDATIRAYLVGHYDAPPPDIPYSEFGPVTDVLVRMGRTVEEQMRELREAEAKYRRIFEKARVGIFRATPRGEIVDVNPACVDLLGYDTREDVLERAKDPGARVFADPADREAILESLRREGRIVRREVRLRRKDGRTIWASATAEAVRDEEGRFVLVEGLVDDVTEAKRMQELMIQTEKMTSVGGLAAGMAHELNNPLGIILQSIDNFERRTSPDHPANRPAAAQAGVDLDALARYMDQRGLARYIASIREAAERAAKIIRTMLEFSRKGEAADALCTLGQIVDTALELAAQDYDLKRKFDFRSVHVVKDLDPATPAVRCAQSELVQVVFNIVRNAAEALADGAARAAVPTITVRSRPEGRFARLEIHDNGPGMAEPTRRRIFEPYFSTKGAGGGTGLGLSVAYFIVTQRHGGTITVDSAPGEGTEFVVRLPVAPAGAGGADVGSGRKRL
jgi:PAS domain S-box-containing protein